MIQVLRDLTRNGGLLDLMFEKRDGLIGDVMIGGCLGHSDHEMVEFKIFSVMTKKVSRVATLDFRRANFKLFRKLVSSIPWESAFEGLGVHECWSVFKNHLLEAQEQAIPLCPKSSKCGSDVQKQTPQSVRLQSRYVHSALGSTGGSPTKVLHA